MSSDNWPVEPDVLLFIGINCTVYTLACLYTSNYYSNLYRKAWDNKKQNKDLFKYESYRNV